VAHRRGAYGETVDELLPVRHRTRRIGASHAQRDLFDQLLIDSAVRGRRFAEARELLTERLVRRPNNRWALRHQRMVRDASAPASL
jgi:hypothetical protein